MRVIGIDPSLTGTAICWGDDEQPELKLLSSPASGLLLPARINRVAELATSVVKEVNAARGRDGVSVFIEAYSYGSKQNRELLAEYGGILRMMLIEISDDINEVAPSKLKKFITGSGKGKKLAMVGTVAKRFGHVFDTDDETDAFSLCRFGRAARGQISDLYQYEKETIKPYKNQEQ